MQEGRARRRRSGGKAMTIRKRLFINFGLILGIMFLLFLVNMLAMYKEHSAKSAAENSSQLAQATSEVRFEMMQNRLTLSNYLLSGDSREVDKLRDGSAKLSENIRGAQQKAITDAQKGQLTHLETLENDWNINFAQKMVEKRKSVDAGNSTVAELQISYLQMDPTAWVKN